MEAPDPGQLFGPYDHLYRAAGILWPDRPGRMVVRAADLLPPGRALDLGCGDGKNLLFLEQRGWTVDGVDISPSAIAAARSRLARAAHTLRGSLRCEDVAKAFPLPEAYTVVIAYGLYHCLDDEALAIVHKRATGALKPGGLFAFAAFTEDSPLPPGHCTGPIHPRPAYHIDRLVSGWETVSTEVGRIRESHPPLIGEHEHALRWALFRKR